MAAKIEHQNLSDSSSDENVGKNPSEDTQHAVVSQKIEFTTEDSSRKDNQESRMNDTTKLGDESDKTGLDQDVTANLPKAPLNKFAVFTVMILSMTEGFAIGYMESLVNIFREKGVHSRQLGVVMILVWPFLLGFLGAPLVDKYYFKGFGKRKTYLLPCKIVIAIGYTILSFYIDNLVNTLQILTIVKWIFVINLVQLFDYNALLGLRYELFGSERSDLAAFSLFCGISIGIFCSYSGFVLLKSDYFCKDLLGIQSGGFISHQFILLFFASMNLASAACVCQIEEKTSDQNDAKIMNTLKLAKLMLTDKVTRRPLFWMAITSCGVMSLKSSISLKLIERGIRREHLVMMQAMSIAGTVVSNFVLKKYMQKGQILTYCGKFLLAYLAFLYIDFFNVLNFDPHKNYSLTIALYLVGLFFEGLCPWGSYQMGFINSITYEKYAASYSTTMMALLNAARILPISLTVTVLDYLWYPLFFVHLNLLNMFSLLYLGNEAKDIDAIPVTDFHKPVQRLQEEGNPLEVNLVVNEKDDEML